MCGIVGYYSQKENNAAEQAMYALYSQQHRGQESAGIVSSNGGFLQMHKEMGYVKEVFTTEMLHKLTGFSAIGHVRYPTRGKSELSNSQPYIIETLSGPIYAIASNGDIVNYDEVVLELGKKGVHFASKNDGELLGRFIVYYHEREGMEITDAIKLLMKRIKGAYSAAFLTRDNLYIFRDIQGFRPLLMGQINSDFAFASESCALDILKVEKMREVEPGEIIVVTPKAKYEISNKNELFPNSKEELKKHHCIFELIYFARPDSFQFNEYVYHVRHRIGAKLASYDNFSADVVLPVPDSANFIALGYAAEKKISYNMGLIRNHYVGRTFIRPDQYMRDESVNQKFNPLKDFFTGKEVVVVDDSIVRGTTIRKLIRMIRRVGAKKVHLRIGSPPVKFSCYYGIDTPTRKELIANNMSVEEIREFVEADSLKYLKIEDLKGCVQTPNNFCYACFTGNYPVPLKVQKSIPKEKVRQVELDN
jgi:amidophosphoribosyltransferase